MDKGDEEYLHSKLRTKGKTQTYLMRPDVLELKERTRRGGKCLGAAQEVLEAERRFCRKMQSSEMPKEYANISKDIWHHVAKYIRPQDIKRYALICKQSADSTRTRRFWLQLYCKYCQGSNNKNKWISELPDHLQMNKLMQCDITSLRHRVIEALFYCHKPFKKQRKVYTLKDLVGRYYMSSWHVKFTENVWIMCYKFSMGINLENDNNDCGDMAGSALSTSQEREVVQDWETLLEQSGGPQSCNSKRNGCCISPKRISLQVANEGDTKLYIYCNRFIPFPSEFFNTNLTSSIRLASTRDKYSEETLTYNLEIDLVSSTSIQGVTLKYNPVIKWEVLPWWHPEFNQFDKCEF